MKIIGIVAEYNPFHNGHLYQINQTKYLTGSDTIVAVMSGNFSQRGEATIADKFTRTKMALLNGVDLVLELPIPLATASAEFFAQGALSILHQSKIITHLSFGSECGNVTALSLIAKTLIEEQERLNPLIKKHLRAGLSFPKARENALCEFFKDTHNDMNPSLILSTLQNPNNILGIEYIKALYRLKSPIAPLTIMRKSAHYHEETIHSSIASATAIRRSKYLGQDHYQDSMPPDASQLLQNVALPSMERLNAFLHYKLMFSQPETLYTTWDIPPDLIRTFIKHVADSPSYEALVNRCTSKTYTKATIQRSLLRLLLEIDHAPFSPAAPESGVPYIRVLGCRKERTDLLKALITHANVPVITNLNKQYQSLSQVGKLWLTYEQKASKLYAYATQQPHLATSDFTHPFIII